MAFAKQMHGSKEPCMGVHMGTTWRIQLNNPCSVAMQAFAPITVYFSNLLK